MWVGLGLVCAVLALAWLIRKAVKGTAFVHSCGCTPNIGHLRPLEEAQKKEERKAKEHLW